MFVYEIGDAGQVDRIIKSDQISAFGHIGLNFMLMKTKKVIVISRKICIIILAYYHMNQLQAL